MIYLWHNWSPCNLWMSVHHSCCLCWLLVLGNVSVLHLCIARLILTFPPSAGEVLHSYLHIHLPVSNNLMKKYYIYTINTNILNKWYLNIFEIVTFSGITSTTKVMLFKSSFNCLCKIQEIYLSEHDYTSKLCILQNI